ncbi:MAG: hypothetical protein Q4G50_01030 [Corynebacterium sp.]|uniref:hypothetical protein n=1 Tax=Corynebacterium sp. TaxID=1720 RepID=UPI0026E0590A|nr:hypothetical protein [Corynebacterium sp.]MDO5668565.1 hypothetical protein [Corynebacterium sp.]
MRPKVLLAIFSVVLLIAALLLVPRATREITYVGSSGVSHDGADGLTVHINTCGEQITRVDVEQGDLEASRTADEPFSGVVAFALGHAAPEGWTLEDNGKDGDADKRIEVAATLHNRAATHHFRPAEVDAAEVQNLEPGRIATGTPTVHGDRLIYQPEQFATDCLGPVTYSPGLGSSFS